MATEPLPIYMWSLLAFAGWTLLVLIGAVGVYRWHRILTGQQAIRTFRSDKIEGADWYRRAMNAHRNCVENIALYAPLVFLAWAAGIRQGLINTLAIVVIGARVAQSITHIGFVETNVTTALRFALFLVQVLCFIVIGWIVVNSTPVRVLNV
ncbi:MAPEG family protein [Dichotomicrobium thermohalophilum]|uniref:MAPEG family protein n=2 Tax=Dichotomicrobium thermohalophilum TaxID=933063 RepID=A0A397Q335_9HYPH|nr:MAPEG family protein [Dichotomicrobium thermohalophilum]